ncbi:MAG TPA: hypothetical protein VD971_04530 [Phycisphaerales bacterium]|nr:hypothetical protein [Phycisphaerales bacterium]
MTKPTMAARTEIERSAKAMYARVLSQWAIDLLQLRRDGLDVPCARGGDDRLVLPHWRGAGPRTPAWSADALRNLTWKPARTAA